MLRSRSQRNLLRSGDVSSSDLLLRVFRRSPFRKTQFYHGLLGAPEVFLPLRGNNAPWPNAHVSMRIPKYKLETVTDPAKPFDAVYFIDTMKPATLI